LKICWRFPIFFADAERSGTRKYWRLWVQNGSSPHWLRSLRK
jgi:hypothetical protein